MFQSFLLLVVAIFGLFLPTLAAHKPHTEQKTEKTCLAEWRAATADKTAQGMTRAAFVARCRGGAATAGTAEAAASPAPSAQPSTNGTATPLQQPSRRAAHRVKRHVADRHGRSRARPKIDAATSSAAQPPPEQKLVTRSDR